MSILHGVVSLNDAALEVSTTLAQRLKKPLFTSEQGFFNACGNDWPQLTLVHSGQRLELRQYVAPAKQLISPLVIETSSDEIRRRISAGRKQAFARALGLHKKAGLQVLDATAGLGRDAMVLAGLGCRVRLLERNPVVHALLEDALRTAAENLQASCVLNDCQNAADYLTAQVSDPEGARFDVVYLDPMYPHEGRKALPKKEMQLVRMLSGEDEDADLLLPLAQKIAKRVVVKRAPKAVLLAGISPAHQIKSNRVRYDVYMGIPQKETDHE